MKLRLLTAVVGIPGIIFCLIVRGWFAELVIEAAAMIGMFECYRALRAAKYKVSPWGGYLAVLVMLPLSQLFGVKDPLILVTAAMGISMAGVIMSKEPTFPNAAATLYPIFTVLLPFAILLLMINSIFGTVPGVALITLAFSIAYGCDAMAFFGGKTLGRHKLCPTISPNKTVEGGVSGLIGGILFSLACRAVFVYGFKMPMPGVPAAIVLGLIGAFAGQIGDLTASMLKRYSGIKDYGKLFPGHGGIIDRMDSVNFVLIVIYCYTLLLK
ncbi:MAG: phosphatidate cytidylyltransferase [Clostridia bacterium]|nr:phosphatidate cytidylyltransferase [Clostridia bacterium]